MGSIDKKMKFGYIDRELIPCAWRVQPQVKRLPGISVLISGDLFKV